MLSITFPSWCWAYKDQALSFGFLQFPVCCHISCHLVYRERPCIDWMKVRINLWWLKCTNYCMWNLHTIIICFPGSYMSWAQSLKKGKVRRPFPLILGNAFEVENMLIWKPNAISWLFGQDCVQQLLRCNSFIWKVEGNGSYMYL